MRVPVSMGTNGDAIMTPKSGCRGSNRLEEPAQPDLAQPAVMGVEVSSSAVEGAGYTRATPAGDFVLEEAARVLADMIVLYPAAYPLK